MTDREKIIKGLECCGGTGMCFHGCPYHEVSQSVEGCTSQLASDALELLKEQEPRAPHYTYLQYSVNGIVHEIKHPECPRCFENGLTLWDASIDKGQAYCKRCGQAVKWE